MVVRREKKSRKMHGYRTRGWGSIGQHRKSGSRGGRGAVGMHKHKWSWMIKYFPDWYGKRGFIPRNPAKMVSHSVINLSQLDEIIDKLAREGTLTYENGTPVVDLRKLGFTKLLGEGTIKKKVKIVVYSASEKAIEKVKSVGGEVVVLNRPARGE